MHFLYFTSDLADQIMNSGRRNGLALMRGFLFWLQVFRNYFGSACCLYLCILVEKSFHIPNPYVSISCCSSTSVQH